MADNDVSDWDVGASPATATSASGGNGTDDPFVGLPDFDSDGIDPDSFDSGGQIDKPGKYHLEIANAENKPIGVPDWRRRNCITLRCTVLQSAKGSSPAGSALFHDLEFPNPEDRETMIGKSEAPLFSVMMANLCNFLCKLGVLVKHEGKVIDPETKSTKLNVRTFATRLKGKQFIGNVVLEKYEDRNGNEVSKMKLDRYHPATAVDDPANYDVPMNRAALQTIGKVQATAPETPASATAKGGKRAAAKAENGATQAVVATSPEDQI